MTPEPSPDLPWASRVILRVEVGSTAHGTGLPGGEDYDELGIMVQPWQEVIGVAPKQDTIVYRPGRAEGERSQPGDYDLQVYGARKFARLALAGNPSILVMLFGPVRFSTPSGDRLRSDEMIQAFWHVGARQRFLGYAKSQRERLLGVRGGAHTNRPELVEEHGYDTKYAMHMVRLGFQGIQFASSGRITLPVPGAQGDYLRSIRRGEVPLDDVINTAEANERGLKEMHQFEPDAPDWGLVNRWLREVFVLDVAQGGEQ